MLGGLPGWTGQLVVLWGQMHPLTELCNHLWSDGVTGCLTWQSGATSHTVQLGKAWLGSAIAPGWVGPQAVAVTRRCHWLDSMFRQGFMQGFSTGQGLRLCPKVGEGCNVRFVVQ